MWSPKYLLRFRWGKSLFILVSSHVALENRQLYILLQLPSSFFCIPAFSAKGEKYLMPTVSVHVLFNETFGICKQYFVGLGKCKFLCIVMRSAYYSNFCGLHCIGLNFAPVPLWPNFLAASELRPFHPSCVMDPKQEHGVNVVSYSWIKPSMNGAMLVCCKRQGKIEKVFLEDQCRRCLNWDRITWRSYSWADQFIISSGFKGLLSLINEFSSAIFAYLMLKKNKIDLWYNSPLFSLCWWKKCIRAT